MIKFLKKYRFAIIWTLAVLLLSLLFIPRQQDLYLETDFEQLENKSKTLQIWTMIIGAVIILFFAFKQVKNIDEVVNVLFGTALLALPYYFFYKWIFLSAFLSLNRIELGDRVEIKYTKTYSTVYGKETPLIYDFRTNNIFRPDKVENIEKLKTVEFGDTVIISFNKGLLGYYFDPRVK